MRTSMVKRLAVTAAVSGAVAVFGLGPVAGPAFAGPRQECAGELEHGGGPPRCVTTTERNPGQTEVTTSQWHGGSFEEQRTCVYTNGGLVPGQSDDDCPESP